MDLANHQPEAGADTPLQKIGQKRISCERREGVMWYTIDQQDDIELFLRDVEASGMRPVSAPMPNKDELYSDETLLNDKDAEWYASVVGSLGYYVTETMWQMACEVIILQGKQKAPTAGAMKSLWRVLAWRKRLTETGC